MSSDTEPTTGQVRGIANEAVSAWLARNIPGAEPPFTFTPITGGHSNLTYGVGDAGGRRYVLRRPPLGAVLATAHDMAREHRIISAVAATDVPVPPALGLCEDESVNDAPFYVMEFVEGTVLATTGDVDGLLVADGARRNLGEQVVDGLVALHDADPDAIGLGDLGRKEAYLDRQLARWNGQWQKSKTRELASMEKAYELLVAAKPEQRYTGIVHGDYRLGNMISRADGTVAAVLDWELCTLGDTLADLGYLLNNWGDPDQPDLDDPGSMPTLAGGFCSREEIVRSYEEKTGRDASGIDYYRAFQHWRLAAICEGVLARYMKGVMGEAGADVDMFRLRVDILAESALAIL